MSIFTIFKRQGKRETSSSASTLVEAIKASAAGITDSTSSRVSVDQNTSLSVPAYLRALNVIAQHVAVLPFRYMWKKGDVYVDKEGDNEHYLLSIQMMDNMSNYQFMYQLVFRTVHYGETLVIPRIVAGECVEYVLVEQESWSHDKVNNIYYVNDVNNGIAGEFKEKEVLHFIWNSKDGKEGFPLWKLCKPALDIYATGDKETQRRFESGGNISGIVSNNVQQGGTGTGVGQYKTSNLSDLATDLEDKFRSGNKIVAVGGDAKFSPFSMSSTDMQFTEQQRRVVNEIARAASVPVYMLYVETSGTQYNTPEVAQKGFQTQTLEPMLRMIESEFQRKRVSRSLCHNRIYKFDRDAIYTLDLKSKADYIAKTIANGTHSINDWRRKENQPTIEGGDEALCTANLMTIDALKAKGTTPQTVNNEQLTDNNEPEPTDEPKDEPTDKPKRERDEHGRFIKR